MPIIEIGIIINNEMAEYRTHMKIIGDILATTRDDLQDEDGATVTYLIRKANISHSRISRILKTLVSQGLLEQLDSEGSNKYKISQTGREFLQAYHTFTNFADNFGLSI
ncbi:MAG: MarR family transcriptional regulator [Nitrosopumilus sp.]|nr:MarR family transcriptional regulator [Nitrosopumilus sp.]